MAILCCAAKNSLRGIAVIVHSGAWGKLTHEIKPEVENLVTLSSLNGFFPFQQPLFWLYILIDRPICTVQSNHIGWQRFKFKKNDLE